MSWIYRISMKTKLFIALMPLLLAMLWLAGSGMISRINNEQQMNTIGELTILARSAGDVVHQLQRERGMSAGFIGSRGQSFREELATQQELTDDALYKLNQTLASTNKDLLKNKIFATLDVFKDNIQHLKSTRNSISDLNIDTPQ